MRIFNLKDKKVIWGGVKVMGVVFSLRAAVGLSLSHLGSC